MTPELRADLMRALAPYAYTDEDAVEAIAPLIDAALAEANAAGFKAGLASMAAAVNRVEPAAIRPYRADSGRG
jgi:hypothetical protein